MNDKMKSISGTFVRVGLTLAIAASAVVTGMQLWRHYVLTPWTRDGRVVADSVTVAAEVSGRIVDIRVRENEYVKKGDILFIVDPASFKAAVDNAKANVASTLATMEMREANAARGHKLSRLSISAEAQQDLDLEAKTAEANYQQAQAVCEYAEINFARTVLRAPVNGYVTNLVLDVGDYADVGKPVLAVVDQDSFRVEAYLEETKLNFVRVGDLAVVTPLSGAQPIKGEVDSIARGIGDTQNPTGTNLLQNVNATFEWVRLAQRFPVRIKLIDVPKDTILSSGMTVTVSIIQQSASKKERIAEIQ
jgi:RND family efflux transporter MFP subunit